MDERNPGEESLRTTGAAVALRLPNDVKGRRLRPPGLGLDGESDLERSIQSFEALGRQGADEVAELGLGEAHQPVTVDARFVLQPFALADVDLGRQPVAAGVPGAQTTVENRESITACR